MSGAELDAVSPSRTSSGCPAPVGTGRGTGPIRCGTTPGRWTARPMPCATTGAWEQESVGNLVELVEERGIKVLALSLDTVGGLAARAWRPELSRVRLGRGERRGLGRAAARFTIARELGHIVLDVSGGFDAERVAHGFGGLPRRQAPQPPRPRQAPRLEARVRRQRPGADPALPRSRHQGRGQLARRVERVQPARVRSPPYGEYGAMAGEVRSRFGRLCLRALAEDAITESKAPSCWASASPMSTTTWGARSSVQSGRRSLVTRMMACHRVRLPG